MAITWSDITLPDGDDNAGSNSWPVLVAIGARLLALSDYDNSYAYSDDNGATWTSASLAIDYGLDAYDPGCQAAASDGTTVIFCGVGAGAVPLAYTAGSWTEYAWPASFAGQSVSFTSTGNAIAVQSVGGDNLKWSLTADSGATWGAADATVSNDWSGSYNAHVVAGGGFVLVLGQSISEGSPGFWQDYAASDDAGATLNFGRFDDTLLARWNGIWTGTAFLVFGRKGDNSTVCKRTDDPVVGTWTDVTLPGGFEGDILLAVLDGVTYAYSFDSDVVLSTDDDGDTWTTESNPATDTDDSWAPLAFAAIGDSLVISGTLLAGSRGVVAGVGGGTTYEEDLDDEAVAVEVMADLGVATLLIDYAVASEGLLFFDIANLSVIANATPGLISSAHLYSALVDLAAASEVMQPIISGILADSASATEAFAILYTRFEHLRDFATATDEALTSQTSALSLLSTAVAMELMARGYDADLVAEANAAEILMESLTGVSQLLSQAEASIALVNNVRAFAIIDENATASTGLSAAGAFIELLEAGADAAVLIKLGDTEYTAWVMNADNLGSSEYRNFGFNSFAEVGNSFFGAREDGLYQLQGDTDNGENILARIRSGVTNFNSSAVKRVPMMYIGYTANGELLFTASVTSPEGAKTGYTYRMAERKADATRENRLKIGKGLASVYWQWELQNTDGADFSVDVVKLWPMVLSRRIR